MALASSIQYLCQVNGIDLSTVPGLQVYNINSYVLPHRKLNIFEQARRSSRKVSSAFYDTRVITVSLYIGRANRALLDQSLDTLYSLIQQIEAPLVVSQSGGVRQYTATFDSHVHNSPRTGASTQPAPQGGHIDLTLNFVCSDNFGYDTNYTTILPATNYSANAVNTQYTQGGGVDTQVPIFQAKIGAITGATGSITIGNLLNGQAITVNRTWSVNDVLIIDTQHQTVQVNGADVNFTGAFPEFGLGTQTWTYTDTFTTRTINLFAYVYNRYF